MPIKQNIQTFTRMPVPLDHASMQTVISDIYDKLQAVQRDTKNIPAQIPSAQQIAKIAQVAAPPQALVVQTNGSSTGSAFNLNLLPGQGISISSDGNGNVTIAETIAFQTGGVANGSQTLLNLVAGSNITLSDSGGSVTISSSGGGTTVGIGVFGSRPASGSSTGQTYYASDSQIVSVWNGSAWQAYVYGTPVTLPTTSTFATAVNVTSSTQSGTTGGVIYSMLDANNTVVAWVKPIFTNTGSFLFNLTPNGLSSYQSGCGFRESATGKLLVVTVNQLTTPSTNTGILIQRWNSPTSFNSSVAFQAVSLFGTSPFFGIRLRQSSTALFVDYSMDAGHTWHQYYTENKTAFFTTAPDQDGPMLIVNGDVEYLWNYNET